MLAGSLLTCGLSAHISHLLCLCLALRQRRHSTFLLFCLQKRSSKERQCSSWQGICKDQRQTVDFLELAFEAEKKQTILEQSRSAFHSYPSAGMRAEIREVKGLLLLRRLLSCSAAAWHFVCMAREAEQHSRTPWRTPCLFSGKKK